ncbi:MAG: DUF4404 family protein [Bacteroidetes bacterium]|nr:DUF4404 family protein [Bacteroidota bacterium]
MEHLRRSLENLHNELKSAKQVDEESIKLLRRLMDDIQKILDKEERTSSGGNPNIIEILKESAQKFELTHPELAGAINIVISGLTNIGV